MRGVWTRRNSPFSQPLIVCNLAKAWVCVLFKFTIYIWLAQASLCRLNSTASHSLIISFILVSLLK